LIDIFHKFSCVIFLNQQLVRPKYLYQSFKNKPMPHTIFYRLISFLFFITIATGCTHQSTPQINNSLERKTKQQVIAITNVHVIPMTVGGNLILNATVVIRNERIESINGQVPADAEMIDGNGKWLMPGLIDMHVHMPTDSRFGPKRPTEGATVFFGLQDYMTLNMANGVTTILELNSRAEHFGQRNEIAKGNVIGSRMALAALLDGGEGQGRRVNNAAEGRQAVHSAKAEGYEFIKLYADLNIETFLAIIDEAKKQGLKTIGHIPEAFKGKLKEAFVPHFGMVAHAEELTNYAVDYSEAEAQQMAQLLKENGTWLSPTLTTMERILSQVKSLDELKALPSLQYVHPLLQSKWLTANKYNKMSSPENIAHFEKYVKFNLLLVKACKKAGVPIVVGTDAGTSSVVAGFAVHDEMDLLVEAGLTAEEVLTSATRLPASWLGIDSELGTVKAGKLADLILLDANPLDDVKNTRKIAGVFFNGRWVTRSTIDAMLADLAKRNTAAKDDYDWKKMIGR
jgi:imidazolonepropionase-like amidohydrolase